MKTAFVILIEGDLYNYTRKLQVELNNLFGTKETLILEPHITIKYAFEVKDIRPFENYFDNLLKEIKAFEIEIKGINFFPNEVAYLNVAGNQILMDCHLKILKYLKKNFGIEPNQFEGKNFHFHITLAYKDFIPKGFEKVKEYLIQEKPRFNYKVKKLGIYLKLDKNENWFIYKTGLLV